MMNARLAVALVFCCSAHVRAQTPTIVQHTTGWCSPTFANVTVTGNLTVICKGVSPKALEVLNRELSKQRLEANELLAEANNWAQKYHDLLASLAVQTDQSELTQKATGLVQAGQLDKAEGTAGPADSPGRGGGFAAGAQLFQSGPIA